jgi:hypothetical protein
MAEETDDQRRVREERAAKDEKIKDDVKQFQSSPAPVLSSPPPLRVFFCELCNKRYVKATEWDNHLSSYDHHHKKVEPRC